MSALQIVKLRYRELKKLAKIHTSHLLVHYTKLHAYQTKAR